MSTIAAEEGAQYVNALLATCQNPEVCLLLYFSRCDPCLF